MKKAFREPARFGPSEDLLDESVVDSGDFSPLNRPKVLSLMGPGDFGGIPACGSLGVAGVMGALPELAIDAKRGALSRNRTTSASDCVS